MFHIKLCQTHIHIIKWKGIEILDTLQFAFGMNGIYSLECSGNIQSHNQNYNALFLHTWDTQIYVTSWLHDAYIYIMASISNMNNYFFKN
jgi:hypothetical protein